MEYNLYYDGGFIHTDYGFEDLDEMLEDAFETIKSKCEEWEDADVSQFLVIADGSEYDFEDLRAYFE